MKLALVTHLERPRLRGTLPDLWPEFMSHDSVVQAFWPKLYEVYPDFQIWVVDREAQPRRAIGYACSVPVAWDEEAPSARGLDWALTDAIPPGTVLVRDVETEPAIACTATTSDVTCPVGDLPAGSSQSLVVTLTLPPSFP